MKRNSIVISRIFLPLVFLALCISGCFEDREAIFTGQLLEWEPPNRASNALSADIALGVDETENQIIPLRVQYAGAHVPDALTAVFEVEPSETTAIEGEHFAINGKKSLTIPPNSSFSEETEVEIFSGAVTQGDTLKIVLRLTEASSVPPMVNYRDFVITVTKDVPPTLDAIRVRLDRPGYNASLNMLDVINGDTYSRNEATEDYNIQPRIDFGLWNSGSTDFTMILPTGEDRLSGFGSGARITNEWTTKNDGVLMKLPADSGNRDLFDGLETEEDILAAFETAEDKLGELGLGVDNGPGKYIQWINSGEMIFFHSFDRNVYMVAIVEGIDNQSTGYLDLDIKRIVVSD
ncbi:hypothetical protein [Sinomicrobium sp.]